jgi:hypothetical protein
MYEILARMTAVIRTSKKHDFVVNLSCDSRPFDGGDRLSQAPMLRVRRQPGSTAIGDGWLAIDVTMGAEISGLHFANQEASTTQ